MLADAPPPEFLTPAQKRHWRDLLRRAPRGVLREIDAELVAAYVVHADTFARLVKEQAARPFVGMDGKPSSYPRLLRQTAEAMRSLAPEMGFDCAPTMIASSAAIDAWLSNSVPPEPGTRCDARPI